MSIESYRELCRARVPAVCADADSFNPNTRHRCRFAWCETSPDNPVDAASHWSDVIYTPASVRDGDPELLPPGRSPLRIGVGLTCDDRENEPVSVVVHIDGGALDLDAQANLTVDEARALSDTLTAAITAATGGVAGGGGR